MRKTATAILFIIASFFIINNAYALNHKELQYIKDRADKGNAKAEFVLGRLYFFGRGVSQNYSKAFFWFKKSAFMKNTSGENALGFLYYHGKGVKRNYSKAAYWYKKSALQGNPLSEFFLGSLYY